MTCPPAVAFGPFELLEPLGGGMSIVYRARRHGEVRELAVKVLRQERLLDGEARVRFTRELHALQQLVHPGICPLLDAGEIDGMPYLCMPLLRGQSLAAHLRAARCRGVTLAATLPGVAAGEPAWRAVLGLGARIADALAVAHRQGFVHRDLKPANLWIDEQGAPLLLDFGLAREAADRYRDLTRTGQIVGTPTYLAPEQLDPQLGPLGPAADVYGLAAVLYECLALVPPFHGASRAALFADILAGACPPPSRYVPDLPPAVGELLAGAMQRRPADRCPDAAAFARAARQLLAGAPLSGWRRRGWRPLASWLRRRRHALATTGVLAAAATGVTFAVDAAAAVAASRDVGETQLWLGRLELARSTHATLPPPWPQHAGVLTAWLHQHGRPLLAAPAVAATAAPELREFAAWAVANVERRVALASLAGEQAATHAARWLAARTAVARDPRYGGLALPTLPGLVPLGPDPRSQLHEFYDLATASPAAGIPERDGDGRLVLPAGHGIVFVLLPAGPRGLLPFLLARHELTRAQYERLDPGRDPSDVPIGEVWNGELHTVQHPVNGLRHDELLRLLPGFGLALPTGAMWDHAAGGGGEVLAAGMPGNHAGTTDGWRRAAPVGSFPPNAFGLCDLAGNVAEPVADGDQPPAAGARARRYTIRGSSYGSVPWAVAGMTLQAYDQRAATIGVRVTRLLETP